MMLSDTIMDMSGNLRSDDRVLKLSVMDGKLAKASTGLVDSRLFNGKQALHVKMDPQTNLWGFQYDQNGLLPDPLKGQFTSFSKAYDFAVGYFARRNVKITEVID